MTSEDTPESRMAPGGSCVDTNGTNNKAPPLRGSTWPVSITLGNQNEREKVTLSPLNSHSWEH